MWHCRRLSCGGGGTTGADDEWYITNSMPEEAEGLLEHGLCSQEASLWAVRRGEFFLDEI